MTVDVPRKQPIRGKWKVMASQASYTFGIAPEADAAPDVALAKLKLVRPIAILLDPSAATCYDSLFALRRFVLTLPRR